ncbi:phosphate transporter PHO1 homolog 9 [Ricinus communis]|uniref:phosphate transporter PHO1 homolog 9 n=1 Tax=Ricinus communis TaxID=3988 RepID=UPI00201A44F2|nr:phosphate transporter PHO1 homolog 9 [Ricinus communis]
MKFGKEFAAQMVQEWQQAYMDYNYLKTILKDVLRFKQRNTVLSPMATAANSTSSPLKRRVSLYRAFSGLTSRYRSGSPRKCSGSEDEVILINPVEDQEGGEGQYQTMFLNATDEGGEYELVFFRKLDDEFNKVVEHYKNKVQEAMAEADDLSRQMDALIALRIKVENPVLGGADINGIPSVSATVVHPINGRNTGWSCMEVIEEVEMSNEVNSNDDKRGSDDENSASGSQKKATGRHNSIEGFKPASLEVLDHVKINVEPETPVSTMKNIISSSKADLSYSKKELRKAEELITRAFIAFYQKLRLLKSYCFLNQLAFFKIMKKYDKITSRNASKAYLKMVDNSYLGSSVEVSKLMERVEATYIKHFANGNRSKGMSILRPKTKREKHRITFSLGFFSGCTAALLIALVIIIHARNVLNSNGGPKYMENMFPLYSFFGFIVLHMLLYSANIYFWKRYRINYAFIFGFKQGTELGYREVFLLSSCLAVLTLGSILSNLDMEMDKRTQSFQAITELVPLGLLILVLLITFCPFNIIYRSSRFFLIQCAFHCMLAPLYKVTLPDFFLADQLTSQVQAFRNLEFYVCYYVWGDFRKRENTCRGSKVFEAFYFVVAMIPYWTRFLQCLRRLFEEKDSMHLFNSIKYFLIVTAVAMRTLYELRRGMFWKIFAAATSGTATIIATYWDIVIDWGLLCRNSRNPWLRDKLVISNKSVYFGAMGLNIVLRLAWMQTVLGFTEAPFLHRTALTAIVACLEIIRRGIWNFFRLENEHLNNVGKYRAFKSVPLPFSYEDDDEVKSV